MKSHTIIISLAVLTCYIDASLQLEEVSKIDKIEFEQFKIDYKKAYVDKNEEAFRFWTFQQNKRHIEEHNQKYEKGLVSYSLGMNRFGDMTGAEFQKIMHGYKYSDREIDTDACTYMAPENIHIRDKADWREVGAVTPVKDQSHCGSCWTFSAAGTLESHQFRKTGKLVTLSEQNLVDCADEYGNNGCEGGEMRWAFRYIRDNRGIDSNESYPYEGVEKRCRFNVTSIGATSPGFCRISSGNETLLKAAVATIGPVAVGIHAGDDFQFYSNGFYYNERCPSNYYSLNHGVIVVGYGTNEDGDDFWIVKNSYGTEWGQKGYIYMPRNKDNWCGIATDASFPLV